MLKLLCEVTVSPEKNYITERKRALPYIQPRTLYVGFTVRVGAKLNFFDLNKKKTNSIFR